MERVEGIEPSHQPWQGRRLPLHHTRFKMVDRKRIELFPKACKAPVLPLSLTAHLKILHQYIVFVKSKNSDLVKKFKDEQNTKDEGPISKILKRNIDSIKKIAEKEGISIHKLMKHFKDSE